VSSEAAPERPEAALAADVLATIPQRALALLIDTVLVLLPVAGLAVLAGVNPFDDGESAAGLVVVTAAWVGIAVVYETVAIGRFGRTVGKRVLGLEVVRRDDGGRVGWAAAARRALVPAAAGLVPWVGFALRVAVYLRAGFHPLRQGWHDAAAGTLVVLDR
jgi:uncharacterized RDD family membrane protein YckC